MRQPRFISVFLLALAVFMAVEWSMLAWNLGPGRPRAFYVVHGILIAVNLVLAACVGAIGWRGLRAARPPASSDDGPDRRRPPRG